MKLRIFIFCSILLPLFLPEASGQRKCTATKIFHKYFNDEGLLAPRMQYHSIIQCNFEPEDPAIELLDMKYDIIEEEVETYLPTLDVLSSDDSQIIEQVYKTIGFLTLRWNAIKTYKIEWENYFLNFGLLEGRTLNGYHPQNGFCKLFISFNFMTREDIINSTEDILDISGKICGEKFLNEEGLEIFRIVFDNTVTEKPYQLKASFLPRTLID